MFEFSRHHCLAICGFIVPNILLLTLGTIILVITSKSKQGLLITVSGGIILSLTMLLHVFSWFKIGVVLGPSYILVALACLCLVINLGAIVIVQFKTVNFLPIKINPTLIGIASKITTIKS